ncbi:FMRFamide receptor-like [Mya arenaria]|uniref:FMRFamide receptor-like n=1 Tax=Mya arenaria TaxID=6604 RepID=UPI0022E55AF6|nr:FMRFamide receptor-like [Mya arenaria]
MSENDYSHYEIYTAGNLIWKVVPPILIIFGTVGNSLSIIVLTRKSIRTSTTALFLTVLAFSDLLVLYTGLLRQWLIYLFKTDVRHVSVAGCKINMWLVYSSLDFSAWILIAVTIERVISVWFPHNAKTICTKKSAMAVIIAICVLLLALNAHILYGMGFQTVLKETGLPELGKCLEVYDDYHSFFNKVWPWIELCVFCLIPFFVIVIGNSLILLKLIKNRRRTKTAIMPSIYTVARARVGVSGAYGKQSSMTAMLLTLNVVFLVSTSPVSIYNIGYPHWISGASPHRVAKLDFWWAVVNMFMYTNNSVNFLLYCLSGSKFRREVFRIFLRRPSCVDAEGN